MAKVFHSFQELAAAQGIKAHPLKVEKTKKCAKCEGTMTHVTDTNIWTCGNCGNQIIGAKK